MSEGDWYASLQDVHVRVRHGWEMDGVVGGLLHVHRKGLVHKWSLAVA